jgi:glutamine synthetase
MTMPAKLPSLHTARLIEASGLELVRFGWCDLHGVLRGKTLTAKAAVKALRAGVGMVSTLLLKDTSDRTTFKVFEPGGTDELPGFAFASNLILLPDPASFKQLPWAQGTGWLRCQPWFQDGTPVPLDTRRILQQALAKLAQQGFGMVCGLEVEFHIYRIKDPHNGPDLDPVQAAWPGQPPTVSMIHPGYNLLAESWIDMAEEPLRIVQHTAQALGLPLQSLEIELGPSQVEAVFDATDALTAADNMVLFRNGVRQALRRAGYHASFMCRPPFPNIMSSGWHLHQSLVQLADAHAVDAQRLHARRARARHHARRRAAHADGHRRRLAGRDCWRTHGAWPRCARPRSTASGVSGPTRWRPRRCCGAATTAARCCAWWAARVTAPRASRTGSASRRPTPTSTWPRKSTPGWTAWRAG